jgi:hypothetical protein
MDLQIYWNNRYTNCGTSGKGSIGDIRKWEWSKIEKYTSDINNVIDLACCDLSFWEGRDCEKYIGIDWSEAIIEKNKKSRPHWTFICGPIDKNYNLKGNIVFCNDVLFHIKNEDVFVNTIINCGYYSKQFIFICTWWKNPLKTIDYRLKKIARKLFGKASIEYQFFRNLNNYINYITKQDFVLEGVHKCTIGDKSDKCNAIYVFRKIDSNKN